jgi:hypothetical protein
MTEKDIKYIKSITDKIKKIDFTFNMMKESFGGHGLGKYYMKNLTIFNDLLNIAKTMENEEYKIQMIIFILNSMSRQTVWKTHKEKIDRKLLLYKNHYENLHKNIKNETDLIIAEKSITIDEILDNIPLPL